MLLLIAFCCIANPLFSQSDKALPEVKIKGRKKEKPTNEDKVNIFAPGQKILTIDSVVLQQYKFQTLANLLSQQTPAFVKSYGFNGLATLNFRGSSSAQSLVLWNGIPLQNAALGIADISTLPVALIDKVSILYGGSSALWGSGNVGGALLLENDLPIFDSNGRKDISVSLGAGSFSQYSGGARLAFGGKRWFISANGFLQSARNNYSYTDNSNTERKMANSHLRSTGLMLNAAYLLGEKNVLSISGWYQHYDREIPPALFEGFSVKNRQDQSSRLMLHWRKEKGTNTFYAKTSMIEDKLDFNDSSIALHSQNLSYQSYNELGWKKRLFGSHNLLVFIPLNYSWMKTTGNSQLRTGLSAAYAMEYFKSKMNISVQASGQIIDQEAIFLPGINTSYSIFNWLTVRANVQRSFRAPALNELYFNPGGNPNLKPEQGWSQDAGYSVKTNPDSKVSLTHDVSVFNRDVKDWIIWFGGAIWTPHNIALVKSRGVETENMLRYKVGQATIHLGLNTAYVIATTQESYAPNDGSIGKQTPYAPRYNGQMNIGFTYKRLYVNYNHTYTGYRFYTIDESAWIEPYNTANLQLTYMLSLPKQKSIQLSFQANNIFNATYMVVSQRPMPGINFMAGAKFNMIN